MQHSLRSEASHLDPRPCPTERGLVWEAVDDDILDDLYGRQEAELDDLLRGGK